MRGLCGTNANLQWLRFYGLCNYKLNYKTGTDVLYIFLSRCNSMVGAVGGEQILNMGDGCQYVGLVLHEFGHAIGYYHEHNRPDRDDTVEVKWDNIVYGTKTK